MAKYVRELYEKHDIEQDKNKPLHGIFGDYIKQLRKSGFIESQMTERILKSSVAIFEAFNDVRNNQRLAHDNKIINHDESILIINNIFNTIKFIDTIEAERRKRMKKSIMSEPDFIDFFIRPI